MKKASLFCICVVVFVLLAALIPINVIGNGTAQFSISIEGNIIYKLAVGVNYWWATEESLFNYRDFPYFSEASINYVRLGAATPERLPQYDTTVNMLLAKGIDILGILQDSQLVANMSTWGDYVYQTVLHFKGRIKCWEVWNEPNYGTFDALTYTTILKVAYVHAKEADPTCFIVSGGLLAVDDAVSYLIDMYANGAKDYMDAVGIHPYCEPASPLSPNRGIGGQSFWELPQLRQVMITNGDEAKKIWITEFGYTSPGGSFEVGDGKTVTEENQALYIRQALNLSATWSWISRFYVYEWADSGGEWAYYGLIRNNYSPPYQTKPSYNAVRDFIISNY